MVADLDIARLRRSPAQSKDKENDPGVHFKPFPAGFKMADVRNPS